MGGEKKGWRELEIGCVVPEPGSAAVYKKGDWRSERPVRDNTKCIKCGICYIYCPDACIREDAEGYFETELYYCTGCGICAHECPRGVITMVEEEQEEE
ncbi:MAG: pyruvate synthase subunit PorD [Methanophagales archaeon ANME-1-THS]|nr:MAG: pyruvate synthase subunit PorD [Methanophagales archaeon ANME-1-THS]